MCCHSDYHLLVTYSQNLLDLLSLTGAVWAFVHLCIWTMASVFSETATKLPHNHLSCIPIWCSQVSLLIRKKSKWIPQKKLDWLGFSFDSATMQITVSEQKIEKVIAVCNYLMHKATVSPRQIASIVGQLISMQRAIGPESRLMTRYLTFRIQDALNYGNNGCLPMGSLIASKSNDQEQEHNLCDFPARGSLIASDSVDNISRCSYAWGGSMISFTEFTHSTRCGDCDYSMQDATCKTSTIPSWDTNIILRPQEREELIYWKNKLYCVMVDPYLTGITLIWFVFRTPVTKATLVMRQPGMSTQLGNYGIRARAKRVAHRGN